MGVFYAVEDAMAAAVNRDLFTGVGYSATRIFSDVTNSLDDQVRASVDVDTGVNEIDRVFYAVEDAYDDAFELVNVACEDITDLELMS